MQQARIPARRCLNNKMTSRICCIEFTARGAFFMHRGRRCLWGLVAIILGLVIMLSLVLPPQFWWFLAAAALIGFGLWYIRCC